MARYIYNSRFFRITHTIEEEGPHPTIPYDYYDDAFTITALLQGNGCCYVEGNCYHMSDGDLMLLGLDEIRNFRFDQEGYHERVSVYFSSAILSPLWEYELPLLTIFRAHPPGVGNKYTPKDYDGEKVEKILSELCDLIESTKDSLSDARIHLLLLQLLFELYDAHEKFTLPAVEYKNDSLILDICRYIHENLTENLSYKHLQKKFPVSRYQLTEIFQRNTGMTLTEYIIVKRLIKVNSLVRGGARIEEAAFNVGFRNYSHFYKEFLKYNHISPRKYFEKKKQNEV